MTDLFNYFILSLVFSVLIILIKPLYNNIKYLAFVFIYLGISPFIQYFEMCSGTQPELLLLLGMIHMFLFSNIYGILALLYLSYTNFIPNPNILVFTIGSYFIVISMALIPWTGNYISCNFDSINISWYLTCEFYEFNAPIIMISILTLILVSVLNIFKKVLIR